MKKIIILMLVCICLISCNFDGGNSNINNNSGSGNGNINNNPEKENIDYTTAEKLEGKTFSYFTQDVEAGDKAVLFKKSIGFGEIDKTSNTIALEIKDFKGTGSNGIYDIKTNSIDGKVLDVTGLDKIREFDKEFTFDGLVYENCDENMKWAKLLEGNTYNYYGFGNHEYLYIFANIDSHNNKLDVSSAWYSVYANTTLNNDIYFYDINTHQEVRKATETADPTYDNIHSITETSFKIGSNTDGNGITTFTKK